jgi:molybdate transport repressor ModE-like protein
MEIPRRCGKIRRVPNWLGVEPRHLAVLVAVRRAGSFRGAATRLGVVQSAVSQRIVQLEQLVGTQLVERSRGRSSVQLTAAGLLLAERADQIIAELGATVADLRALTEQEAPTLRVGGYESVTRSLVPGALTRLADAAPELAVALEEDPDWERLFPLVADGTLDAAFADLPLPAGPFAYTEVLRDPWVLLVHRDSPLGARVKPPALAEIGALPLIVGSRPLMRLVTEHVRAAGIEPRFPFESPLDAGVQALVAEGMGAALAPRLSVIEGDPRIAVICLDGILPPRRIALYWHRKRRHDGAVRSFLAALRAECARTQKALDATPISALDGSAA